MLFFGRIWWIVTPGGGEKPIAPRWLWDGMRSIQNCMSFGGRRTRARARPESQRAVCGIRERRRAALQVRRDDRSRNPFSPGSRHEKFPGRENRQPTQRSSPFDLAMISEENDISDTSKSAKAQLTPEELRRMHGARYERDPVGLTLPSKTGPGLGLEAIAC